MEEDGQLLMTFKVDEVNEQSLRDLTGWTLIGEAIDATIRGESFTFDKERAQRVRKGYDALKMYKYHLPTHV